MLIDHPVGGRRIIAYGEVVAGRLAFLDVGWNDSLGRHPAHVVEGPISGDGPWQVGIARVELIRQDDPQMAQARHWAAQKPPDAQARQVLHGSEIFPRSGDHR